MKLVSDVYLKCSMYIVDLLIFLHFILNVLFFVFISILKRILLKVFPEKRSPKREKNLKKIEQLKILKTNNFE